jgi:homoserine dehydrogenase
MSRHPLTVLKFGGSVLTGEDRIPVVVQEIYDWVRDGHRVVAVVSAIGSTTDDLLRRASRYGETLPPEATACLVGTGETASASLLTLALHEAGIPATLLEPAVIRLRTHGPATSATPIDLDAACIRRALGHAPVVVVPGFIGCDAVSGATTLLGRGGSDLTALFLARHLRADVCRLVKDVSGLYERDPALPGPPPRRYESLHWDDALALGGGVVQPQAIEYARAEALGFEVASVGFAGPTRVESGPRRWASCYRLEPCRRVALVGLGVVGRGVYDALCLRPDRFDLVGVLVRRPDHHVAAGVPRELLTTDPGGLLGRRPSVVVDVSAGVSPSAEIVRAALASGCDVVTANKELVASRGPALEALAAATGARLRYSASVGGAVPVVERVRASVQGGRILSISGVVNGTSNFVLDRMAAGNDEEAAVEEARRLGFAEADPTRDLDGTDAAFKLIILAREAFGVHLGLADVQRSGIDQTTAVCVRRAQCRGRTVRMVASVRRRGHLIDASVRLVGLPARHFLAGARNEDNRVVIVPERGAPVRLTGKGAGRRPTATAVVADVIELDRLGRGVSSRTCPKAAVEEVA